VAADDTRSDDPDLTPDPLAPETEGALDTITMTGILGESPNPDFVRLFLDLDFGTYYDMPRDAVLRREKLPAERSSLGVDSSLLIVQKNTPLVVNRVAARLIEHEFLAGDFTAPGTFRSYSALEGEVGVNPMYIPTYTIYGYICCRDALGGRRNFQAAGDTQGPWPTGGGSCTAMRPCMC
jgi:hypothetical protein